MSKQKAKNGKMILSSSVPEALHEAVLREAKKRGMSKSAFVISAVNEALSSKSVPVHPAPSKIPSAPTTMPPAQSVFTDAIVELSDVMIDTYLGFYLDLEMLEAVIDKITQLYGASNGRLRKDLAVILKKFGKIRDEVSGLESEGSASRRIEVIEAMEFLKNFPSRNDQ